MVINIGLALEGNWHAVRDDIAAVVEAAQGKCVKVIVKPASLTSEQIAAACREAAQAGAQYVKPPPEWRRAAPRRRMCALCTIRCWAAAASRPPAE